MTAASMTSVKRLNRSGNANCWGTDCNDGSERAACAPCEIMTILIGFHQSCYRNFKAYYQELVQGRFQAAFPGLVSYGRFIEWMPSALLPLCAYVRSCFGSCSGISFMDSTSLKVCHNRRIPQHKVFQNIAARGKTGRGLVLW